jgi:hypothetical protein
VPPPLVSVGQQARHPTAILGPLPGVDAAFIYVATKPDRASDGSFLQENIEASDILTDDEIARSSWLYEAQLDPGGYYVMARAFDFECYINPNCIEGFSNMLSLTVPKPDQRYRASVQVLSFIGVGYLTLTVTPLGERLPYRVCWGLRGSSSTGADPYHGARRRQVARTRCARATVLGYSWNEPASSLLRVSLRGMRRVTTFTWYADGRVVAVKRVRIRR